MDVTPYFKDVSTFKQLQPLEKSPLDSEKESAATLLQSLIRRTIASKSLDYARKYHINPEIISRARKYLNTDTLNNLPKPDNGKSRDQIRILQKKNLNLLIRIATTKEEKKFLTSRYRKMRFGHEIIESIGAKHLLIPNATLTSNYLFEKFLPLVKGGKIGTLSYYAQNHKLYDDAVSEMTLFFTKTNFKHVINRKHNSMKSVWEHGSPRYDNITTCVSVKDGKIYIQLALIDLERLFPRTNKPNHIFKSAKKAILLFPFNFHTVISTCSRLELFTNEEIITLNNYRISALNGIDKIYGKHHTFLEQSLKSKMNPFTKFLSSEKEMDLILENLKRQILELRQNTPAISYLIQSRSVSLLTAKLMKTEAPQSALITLKIFGNNPEVLLEEYTKDIYAPMIKQFCQHLEKIVDKTDNDPELTKHEIMSLRSLRQGSNKYDPQFELKNGGKFTCEKVDPYEKSIVADYQTVDPSLRSRIIRRVLNKGEIAFAIDRCILDLMKEKKLLAEVYHDDSCSTFFF